ncbi:MAG: hypothetical protein ACRCXZ_00975, partial [Patescibacteria group bacterium]
DNVAFSIVAKDCMRTNLVLAGLKSKTIQQAVSYEGPIRASSFFSEYKDLIEFYHGSFKTALYNFGKIGFIPTSKKPIAAKNIISSLKVGDVIYINPLHFGYKNFEETIAYEAVLKEYKILKEVEKHLKKNKSSKSAITAKKFQELVNNAKVGDIQNPGFVEKEANIKAISNVGKLLLTVPKVASITTKIESLGNWMDSIDSRIEKQRLASPRIINIQGNKFTTTPDNSQFHVATVVSIKNGIPILFNIDGGRPLEKAELIGINEVVKPQDMITIFRSR